MNWPAGLLLAILTITGSAAAEDAAGPTISRFSKEPVPRFETLKAARVNGRIGPSFDHKIVWRYERRGLPVLVIKESDVWRRVRDPAGDEVWIHEDMLADGDTAYVLRDVLLQPRLDTPADDLSRARARVEAGALIEPIACRQKSCRVRAGGRLGWVPRDALWGIDVPADVAPRPVG